MPNNLQGDEYTCCDSINDNKTSHILGNIWLYDE